MYRSGDEDDNEDEDEDNEDEAEEDDNDENKSNAVQLEWVVDCLLKPAGPSSLNIKN